MYVLDGNPLSPPPEPTNSNFFLISVLQREKLIGGTNYLDWMCNLRITLRYDDYEYVMDNPIPNIDELSTEEENVANYKHVEDLNKVSCIMIASMCSDLKKTFKNTWDYEMNLQLDEMFQKRARQERLKL